MMRPRAVRHHVSRHRLRDEKGAAQVRVENQVPVVPRDVDRFLPHVAAGVVDEDVDALERAHRGVYHLANARLVPDVELQWHDAASHRFDFRLKRLQRFERTARHGEIGARARKSPAESLAESAARAGDDGDFAGEVEQ